MNETNEILFKVIRTTMKILLAIGFIALLLYAFKIIDDIYIENRDQF